MKDFTKCPNRVSNGPNASYCKEAAAPVIAQIRITEEIENKNYILISKLKVAVRAMKTAINHQPEVNKTVRTLRNALEKI